MTEICVVYLSEDEAKVDLLVRLLRRRWGVWWAKDIAHGNWEDAVRAEIHTTSALVPVLSEHARGDRLSIIRDEMHLAKKLDKPILPFLIGPAEIPFGFGLLDHTEALGWGGDETHPGYQRLVAKLSTTMGPGHATSPSVERPPSLTIRRKELRLPAFAFSLSSHETQVTPNDGAILLRLLGPPAALVSAYDVRISRTPKSVRLYRNVERLRDSETVLFLDSGNYESYRKADRYSPKANPTGWRQKQFQESAALISPDLALSFDTIGAEPSKIVATTVRSFRADDRALRERDFPLCPIVHLSPRDAPRFLQSASSIVSQVASELDPFLIAVPERELGDGLFERMRAVRAIRRALDALGKYYPLHLLGTGNPISIISLAAAGADVFDGLEWCRTVADSSTGFLFHFHHFDCFSQPNLSRIHDQGIRLIVENPKATYAMRTLSSNVDFFNEWTRTMQNMLQSGQVETLLKFVPHIGPALFEELLS